MNIKLKLKHQLNLMFMVIGCLVLTISLYAVYYQTMNILTERSEHSTVSQFQQMERAIISFRQEVERHSVELLLDPLVRDFLRARESEVDRMFAGLDLGKMFKQVRMQSPYLESILLFSQEGDVVSEANSSQVFKRKSRDQPFYGSAMYEVSSAQSFRMFWYGGRRLSDFVSPDVMTAYDDASLVSTVRFFEVPQAPQRGGILVLNINEQQLASIYSSLTTLPGESAYIVDEAGIIMSSQNKQQLGQLSEVFDRLEPGSHYGSLTYQADHADVQVVYYKLENSGWMLIKEIPIKLFNKDLLKLQRILIIALISSLVLMILAANYWIHLLLGPLRHLADRMRRLERGQLGVLAEELPHNEIGLLSLQFNRMSQSIAELVHDKETIEAKKRKHEIKALQAQISPHFLYNTLNVIRWMAVAKKADDIADSVVALGNMVQPFYKNGSSLCSLQEEIEYIRNYVKLMNRRYGEGIQLDVRIPDPLWNVQVLKFMLQPIVENAIQHGFEQKQFRGSIEIDVTEENGWLLVTVEDEGSGMTTEQLHHVQRHMEREFAKEETQDSIGLNNTHQRLKLHFGSEYGIHLYSRYGQGTIVTLSLPLLREES